MKKRNIMKYVILPVIFFSTLALSVYPESHAKFVKKDKATYNTTLKQLTYEDYDTGNVTLDNASDYQKAIFNISFDKNKVMYDDSEKYDKADSYKISVIDNKNHCKVMPKEDITTTGNIGTVTENEIPITYEVNSILDVNSSDTVSFKVSCKVVDDLDVADSAENIYLRFKIDETINNYENNPNTEFTYLDYARIVRLDEYYSVDSRKRPSDTYTHYDKAVEALKTKYTSESDTVKGYLVDYFKTVFTSSMTDQEFEDNYMSLQGFRYTKETNTYNFDDNYLGYALTWQRRSEDSSEEINSYTFFYSSNNLEDRTTAFLYYILRYGSSTLKENEQLLINYINGHTNGYQDLFDDKINAIRVYTTSSTANAIEMNFADGLIDIIKNRTASPSPMLANNLDSERMFTTFTSTIRDKYSVVMADRSALYWYIADPNDTRTPNDTIFNSLTRNSYENITARSGQLQAFSDILVLQSRDTTRTAILDVYSGVTGSLTDGVTTYTYFDIYEIASGEIMTLAYVDSTTQQSAIDKVNELSRTTLSISSFSGTPTSTSDEIISDGTGGMTTAHHNIFTIDGVDYDILTYDSIPGVTYIRYTQP